MRFFTRCLNCTCDDGGRTCTGEFQELILRAGYFCNGCDQVFSKQPISCPNCRTRYFTHSGQLELFSNLLLSVE